MQRIQAASIDQMDAVRVLFREYQQSLDVDLCFQSFEEELVGLPGKYVVILLAGEPDKFAGCVALRPLENDIAEMKRLYVRPKYRGEGLGRALAEAIIAEARSRGYKALRLDTLPQMRKAIALYRAMGFHDIEPYYLNPVCGSLFLELTL
jgi:ribosomal protein S18 acetylase RimI-like enzyme